MKTTSLTVDWSYPSSPNATRFKRPAGCWSVSRCTVDGTRAKTETIAGPFDSQADGLAYAATLGEPILRAPAQYAA